MEKFDKEMEDKEGKRERSEKHPEKKDDHETSKNLDNLHAFIDTERETHTYEYTKNKELQDSRQHMEYLKKSVPTKIAGANTVSSYEHMSQEDITHVANKERTTATNRVQQMVNQTSWIPAWLKKMSA